MSTKLELHFLEITFVIYFQVSMDQNRHFVHHLKCKGKPYSFHAWKVGAGYCGLLQFMQIVIDMLAHLVVSGQCIFF